MFRFLFSCAVIAWFITLFQGPSTAAPQNKILSYKELVAYPVDCAKKDAQLEELRKVQEYKNFKLDPDELDEFDRAYNSRLKATIWYYAYGCEK